MSYQPFNLYGQPPAGQVPQSSFPGYPAGALPSGYPAANNTGRTSPTTEVRGQINYPAGSVYPSVYPAAGQYVPPPQQNYPYLSMNSTPYTTQTTHPGYPASAHMVYPTVPPATGGYSFGQAPGGYSYSPQDVVGYVFTPSEHEKNKHKIEVKFSPAMDRYVRVSEHNQELNGWRQLVYAEQNIQRKVEHDHKMSYLTRKESSVAGRVEWRFDVSSTGRRISKLRIQFPTKLYEDGYVNAYVATDRGTMAPLSNSDRSQEVDEARGSTRFSIIAELSRGKGEHAWQHAQLFRQELNPGFFSSDDAHYPFKVLVEFE